MDNILNFKFSVYYSGKKFNLKLVDGFQSQPQSENPCYRVEKSKCYKMPESKYTFPTPLQ